jgi:hypothetical protein
VANTRGSWVRFDPTQRLFMAQDEAPEALSHMLIGFRRWTEDGDGPRVVNPHPTARR